MRRAAEADPASMVIAVEVGEALAATGRIEEASAQYERVLAVYPAAFVANDYAWKHFGVVGDFERCAQALYRLVTTVRRDSVAARRLADAIRDPSTRVAALRAAEAESPTAPSRVAVSIMLGDENETVALLEKILADPDGRALVYMPAVVSLVRPPLSQHPRVVAAFKAWREKYYGRKDGTTE